MVDELAKVVGAQAELHALELKDEIAFFKDRYKELALIFAHGDPHKHGLSNLGGARGGGARGGGRASKARSAPEQAASHRGGVKRAGRSEQQMSITTAHVTWCSLATLHLRWMRSTHMPGIPLCLTRTRTDGTFLS